MNAYNEQDARLAHCAMVTKLQKDGAAIAAELSPTDAHLWHMATGVAGEAGELLDAVKKAVIYRQPIDVENLTEELGDLEFYLEGIRQAVGVTRTQTLNANISKLRKRYPGLTYADAAATARKDKTE